MQKYRTVEFLNARSNCNLQQNPYNMTFMYLIKSVKSCHHLAALLL